MKISIVIPNYNGEKLLEKNLPAVFAGANEYKAQTKNDVEVIIVDDKSSDGSIDILEVWSKKDIGVGYSYIVKEKNEGFAPTVNRGVEKATGEIIILLNTDVSPQKDFLGFLVEHFSDEKVFAVGAMDKSIEDGQEVLRGRGIGKWTRGFLVHSAGNLDKKNTLWVSGGSGAFRKNLWEKLGGLEQLYAPFYWEDIDISYKALKSGYSVLFEKRSVVTHEHEKGAIKTKYSASDIQKIAYRNQCIFVWENADTAMLWVHFFWLPYHLLKALLRYDKNFFMGFFAACKLANQIIQKRKIAQKQFIYSDYAIITHYQE